jgi:YfiH family protein
MSGLAFEADWPAPAGVNAWVSSREGGGSTGAYATLNLAGHVGDDPRCVAENRRRLAAALGLPGEPCWLRQVHGSAVADLDRGDPRTADGAVSGRPGTVCVVLTADCLPILLCSKDGRRVSAAHAGWRGLARGVVRNCVRAMATPPTELLAWLGPAIGAEAYEVGDEVRAAFTTSDPAAGRAFTANARGRWQADLYALARLKLEGAGVTAVHGGNHCVYKEETRFFSHRRDGVCGRMATLIWRDARVSRRLSTAQNSGGPG